MSTNKGGIVKQSGNDVEGYRSQTVLLQPNVHVFLQYRVKFFKSYQEEFRLNVKFVLTSSTLPAFPVRILEIQLGH